MKNPSEIISSLNLQPHPEGGWYLETYRSKDVFIGMKDFPEGRHFCTAIYFLITADSFSALHRIKSDETWHFYDGNPFEVIEINNQGILTSTVLGRGLYQYTVPAGNWFGSRVLEGGEWSLVACTVSPGFDFRDFELANRHSMLKEFPGHKAIINELTRDK